MTNAYFLLGDDVDLQNRWHLGGLFDGTGRELDTRCFRYGRTVDLGPPLLVRAYDGSGVVGAKQPLQIPVRYAGKPLDFTFAAFDMPVVKTHVAELLAGFAESQIQRIPVYVEGQIEMFEIINVADRVDCIDRDQSRVMWWTPADGRPDKVGKPRMITKLMIDPSRAAGRHIFRLADWEVVLIVSAAVKATLEQSHIRGVHFQRIT